MGIYVAWGFIQSWEADYDQTWTIHTAEPIFAAQACLSEVEVARGGISARAYVDYYADANGQLIFYNTPVAVVPEVNNLTFGLHVGGGYASAAFTAFT